MSINIGPPSVEELRPRITVIGVGGAGGNAIANMIEAQIEGVDFIVANTDAQALNNSLAEHRIQLGPECTRGLGAGSRPEVGRAAAEETVEEIERALEGVNMVFIAADGRIHRIAERTVPRSLATIESNGPVRATLELAALGFLLGQLQNYLNSVPQSLMRYDLSSRVEMAFGTLVPLATVGQNSTLLPADS